MLARVAIGLGLLAGIAACAPTIGDKCQLSTDCSVRGDRLCDTSQPGGYCTQLNCLTNGCPDEGSCVLFGSSVPGCGFDDRNGNLGARTARSVCTAACDTNSDCRSGYVCADPRKFPWNAVILDDNQIKKSCLPIPLEGQDASVVGPVTNAPVCNAMTFDAGTIEASAPSIDASGPVIPPLYPDAGALDSGAPAPADAGSDG